MLLSRDMTQDASTDAEPDLVRQVLAGETAAFERILTRHQSRVFAMARRYARQECEAEDLVQDIFIKAFQKLSSYRAEAPFEHWLMTVAVRTCYDHLRSRQRRPERVLSDLSEEESAWLEKTASAEDRNESLEQADAARTLVGKLLDQLSPKARLVLTLLEIEEKSVKEIAALTGWSVPLVKVRAFRARREMRKLLEQTRLEKFL